MNLNEYLFEVRGGNGKLSGVITKATTKAQLVDVMHEIVLPALEQLLHNDAVAQEKILTLERQVAELTHGQRPDRTNDNHATSGIGFSGT